MKRFDVIYLIALMLVGFLLRVWFLPQNALTFGYDQARDALVVQSMLQGDFKIQGPSANMPGLYHGVLYYYFLLIPYFVGHGSPIVAATFLSLYNVLNVVVIYLLAFEFTKNRKTARLAAFFYAISFESVQYSTWLSNPSLAVLTVPLFYLCLWRWLIKKDFKYAAFAGLALAASIQSEIFLAYHTVIAAYWIYRERKSIEYKHLALFIGALLLGLSTMIASEIKFGFKGIGGVQNIFASTDIFVKNKSVSSVIEAYVDQLGTTFARKIFPLNLGFGAIIGFVVILWFMLNKKYSKGKVKYFLLSYLFSHLLIVSFGGFSTPYIAVGIGTAVKILLAIAITELSISSTVLSVIAIMIIAASNLLKIYSEDRFSQTIFAVVPSMTLSNELQVIDYTYEHANHKPFSLNTITNPMWMNTTWTYLYNWYGYKRYGYVPKWHGREQFGEIRTLPYASQPEAEYATIVEPVPSLPQRFVSDFYQLENSRSMTVEQKSFGGIIVDWRKLSK